jgi:hypothetical protein
MDLASVIILSVYGAGFIVVFGIIIYLIFRRSRIKETEDFDDREN